jgi:L-cystine transport system substrate-binding protein
MTRSILVRISVLLSVFLIATGAATAAPTLLDQIKSSGTLKVGTEGTYAPFTFHDAANALTGFDVEIARALAKRLGVKAEFVEGKWDGLIAGLDAKRYDVVINEVTITDARKAKYDFSDVYIVSKAALVVRSDNTTLKSYADLKGKKAGESLTSNFAELARSYGAEVVQVDGFNQAIDLLLAGRVDATINDSLSFLDFKKQKPDAALKAVDFQKNADLQAVLLRKGNPELLAAINKALADIKSDGTYLAISRKYFNEDVSK